MSPITRSPSISIATLSDFTVADASDDESFVGPTITDDSDDEPSIDPTAVTPHGTFYLRTASDPDCGFTTLSSTWVIAGRHLMKFEVEFPYLERWVRP